MTATIAVDFDGVIHAYREGWRDGTIYDAPIPGAFESLRALMERYAVFIHTARNVDDVAEWITAQAGIPTQTWLPVNGRSRLWEGRGVLLVTDRKLPALAYIDDRAIHFTNWDHALAEVHRREHNEGR